MSKVIDAPMEQKSKVPIKGFKYRLYPTDEQVIQLNQVFGCSRYVNNALIVKATKDYNEFKAANNETNRLTKYKMNIRYEDVVNDPNRPWLREVGSVAYQEKERDVIAAFKNFFTYKKGYPQIKRKKDNYHSFRISGVDSIRIREEGIIPPKFKSPITIKWSRKLPGFHIPGRVTSYTISRNPSNQYFISFTCEYTPDRKCGTGSAGIDLGIKDLAIDSNGNKTINQKYYEHSQRKLAILQRKHSKAQKGGKNREKLRLKVAKLYQHITNQRVDYLHKFTSNIVKENQFVCIEDLNTAGMVKNHKLAKSIMDASWGKIYQLLAYKIHEAKGKLFLASRWYPSTQACNKCGCLPSEKITLKIREWSCEHCGSHHDRDINAAMNLKSLMTNFINSCINGLPDATVNHLT